MIEITRFIKTPRAFILGSLLVVSFAASAVRADNLMELGPGSTGGGDLTTEPITPADVRASIEVVKSGLKYFFGRWEQQFISQQAVALVWDVAPLDASDPRLRFFNPKAPSVFELLPRIQFDIRETEPCVHDGQPHDGSAVLPATVCLSVASMAKRAVPLSRLPTEVMALAVHEVAHLRGAGENEAKFFQAMARKTTIDEKAVKALYFDVRAFKGSIGGAEEATDWLERVVVEKPLTAPLCQEVKRYLEKMKGFLSHVEEGGVNLASTRAFSIVRGFAQFEMQALYTRAHQLQMVCEPEKTDRKRFLRRYLGLVEREEIPFSVSQLGVQLDGSWSTTATPETANQMRETVFSRTQAPVHYVKEGDTQTLLKNLQSIRDGLKRLHALVL